MIFQIKVRKKNDIKKDPCFQESFSAGLAILFADYLPLLPLLSTEPDFLLWLDVRSPLDELFPEVLAGETEAFLLFDCWLTFCLPEVFADGLEEDLESDDLTDLLLLSVLPAGFLTSWLDEFLAEGPFEDLESEGFTALLLLSCLWAGFLTSWLFEVLADGLVEDLESEGFTALLLFPCLLAGLLTSLPDEVLADGFVERSETPGFADLLLSVLLAGLLTP